MQIYANKVPLSPPPYNAESQQFVWNCPCTVIEIVKQSCQIEKNNIFGDATKHSLAVYMFVRFQN